MTQICPGFGVAPVPTLLSVIFRPDGVVMVAPAAWAVAAVGSRAASAPANAVTRPSTATALAGGNMRILSNSVDVVGEFHSYVVILLSVGIVARRPPSRPGRRPSGIDARRCRASC